VGFIGFYRQNWVRVAFGIHGGTRQVVQVMHWTLAKQLTDLMDAGEPIN